MERLDARFGFTFQDGSLGGRRRVEWVGNAEIARYVESPAFVEAVGRPECRHSVLFVERADVARSDPVGAVKPQSD